MSSNSSSRREFCKKSLLVLGAAPFIAHGLTPSRAYAQGTKAIAETDPQAMALGYVHDATKVDTTKFPKKKEAGGENQKCATCMLYVKGGLKADGMEGEYGQCSIFPQGLVAANGWCNTWAKKA